MADNPLLPQDRLRELYALMSRVHAMERRKVKVAREALLAATLIHLSAGDLVCAAPGDSTLQSLAPKSPGGAAAHHLPASLRIPLCAGAARGLQTAGTDRVAVAFASAGTSETGWEDALRWAHRDELPLLLVVADTGRNVAGRQSAESLLLWPKLTKVAGKLHLPHFPVDGEDAVAVFRVVQETAARARAHGGPSVIWAMLNAERPAPGQQPLRRLQEYMTARGISLNSLSR
ncbi:MAG TPA: thiamine pyrophosphate-dependent enzyme [Candidatus Aquilonibacter sp.]|nr:thiamine pyrophosphate-dependent enzyme [Candidatus Aquilonibacter sp.]